MDQGNNLIESWVATLRDGSTLTSEEAKTFDRVVERGGCSQLEVRIAGRDEPIYVSCVPERGEEIRLFTRRAIKNAMAPDAFIVNMPIVELRHAGGWTRLHVHPQHGAVFSTIDLNL